MEFMFSLFQTILFSSVALILTFLIFSKKRSTTRTNLPPGSNGWPLIGETLEFLSKPETFIHDRMNKYSTKCFKTRVFGEQMVVLCGTAGNKFVGTNERKLFRAWRPQSMQMLFRSSYQSVSFRPLGREEELHLTQAPGFLRAEALVGYVEGMDNIIKHHLKMNWEEKQIVNVLDQMERMTIAVSTRFYLGIKDTDRVSKFSPLFHDIGLGLHSITLNFPGTLFYAANKSRNALWKELLLIIKERKAEISAGRQTNDILSYLIMKEGHNGKLMPENEICDKVMGLLMGAFSSPAAGLAFIFKFIAESPEVYEKIRQEQLEISGLKNPGEALNWEDLKKMKYSWSVCLEVMRCIPPLQGTFREAITDFTYEGFTIPKGWKIYWTISSTNKNSEYFPNPEEFIAGRFVEQNTVPPYTNVPFGGGPRICPGKEYSRLVLLTILHNAIKSFKWDVIYPDEKTTTSFLPLPEMGLPVRLTSL